MSAVIKKQADIPGNRKTVECPLVYEQLTKENRVEKLIQGLGFLTKAGPPKPIWTHDHTQPCHILQESCNKQR